MLDVKTCVRVSFVSLSPPIGSQHKLIAGLDYCFCFLAYYGRDYHDFESVSSRR